MRGHGGGQAPAASLEGKVTSWALPEGRNYLPIPGPQVEEHRTVNVLWFISGSPSPGSHSGNSSNVSSRPVAQGE